ncbi:type I polyketide synthase [Collimonas pratensis]|uniref:Zinc-binding dehydrogenase family protein n=1 Tax=Collimonas pratensis TaxID=279113 RepID=A0A127QBX7_9BURK|nr:type I polyketide synthase [Collimonas pratensis]AMP07573.1 zinc-binding dehydrogenase family protein [Collimonas pratensis]
MLKYQHEPIAIIGIGCRFPGGVCNPAEYWELLKNGKDGIVDIPSDRWNADEFYDPNPATPGKMYVRAGGFITQKIKEFDASFFGISPREAGFIDPQQRLLMEVAWEALEDAGLQPDQLAGSDTGVYIGGFMLDNLLTQFSPLNRDQIGPHSAVGSTLTILSNRLSYIFDFRGPSLTLDTACSSSLVAMHEACQSIWRGECALALFGGVNVMHRPENLIAMCKGGFLSPDGRSKSFDIRANGYGRGEGAGIVVLKPYSAALRDGDDIYGLVRGTGANQDGRTDGITVPNPDSQEALIRKVCAQAQVDPQQIRYVEAHGTGTPIGDPLEARAIGAALGQGRTAEQACVIGSVKANIGHLEAASGVAGLIKLALCLKHNAIPPLANLTMANPNIPFAELGLRLPLALEPMPPGPGVACVSINSFGYGGTNAHAILEQFVAEPAAQKQDGSPVSALHILPLSARSKAALTDLAQSYHAQMTAGTASLHDLCFSAALRRGHQDQRLALVADTQDNMLAQLRQFIDNGSAGMAVGAAANKGQKPVFVLTGMGPQWWAMGRELLAGEPVFRRVAEECDLIFKRLSGWSILDEMLRDEASSRIAETQIAQPANFVVQAGLAALWRSWGVEPAAVVGHSVGEVSAAYIAGVLDLEDALLVSYHRSRIQRKAAGIGTMLAVGLSAAAAAPYLAEHPGLISLAAANGPTAVTLSGDTEVLQRVAEQMRELKIFHRFLAVEVAYHSHTMEPLKAEMLEVLAGLTIRPATVPLYSTVSGDLAAAGDYDAAYWCDNIREPVYFGQAMNALLRDGHRLFLEVGPHPVLSSSIRECMEEQGVQGALFASLRRGKPEHATIFDALAGLYSAGTVIDWPSYYEAGGAYVKLPAYPWQREEHWNEGKEAYLDRVAYASHALLGRRIDGPKLVWQSTLNGNLLPYLPHHRVEDLVILPGAAYVELGLAIHREIIGKPQLCLENLEFHKALIVSANCQPRLHVTYDEASRQYAVFSREREGEAWSEHARGQLSHMPLPQPAARTLDAIRTRCVNAVTHTAHYADMRGRGLQYGPYFQGVRNLWLSPDGSESLVQIEGHPALAHSEHNNLLHPSLLDACFQSLLAGLTLRNDQNVYVPVHIDQIRWYGTPTASFCCHSVLHHHQDNALVGDVTLCDSDGNILVEVLGVRAQALTKKSNDEMADLNQWLYQFEWEKSPATEAVQGGRWLLLADSGTCSDGLAQQLRGNGADSVVTARAGDAFTQVSASEYVIRSGNKDDMQRLLELSGAASLRGVIHLWSLDAGRQADDIGTANVVSAMHLVQSVAEHSAASAPQLFFVTAQAQAATPQQAEVAVPQAALIGFVRVAMNEFQQLRLRLVDVDPGADPSAAVLAHEILSTSREQEVALRADGRHALRLVRRSPDDLAYGVGQDQASAAAAAGTSVPAVRRAPAAHEVEIALGRIVLAESEQGAAAGFIGAEAFGVVAALGAEVQSLRAGDCVMLRLQAEPAAFMTVAAAQLMHSESFSGTRVDAIQLTSFTAAYHALYNVARLRQGECILIHNAASRQGQAAIQVARWLRATVYVTAATAVQRDYLHGLGLEHVFDSGSMEFVDRIKALTDGRGLDVVLNDLGGEIAGKTRGLLGPFGRFIDSNRGQLSAAETVRPLQANQSQASIDIGQIIRNDPGLFADLAAQVSAHFAAGDLQALAVQSKSAAKHGERNSAEMSDQPFAFKVVDFGDAAERIASASLQQTARFDGDASYLITGGFGGFGLQMASWLASQGVRHLVLVGRSGASTPEARQAVQELQQAGVQVFAAVADIADDVGVQQLLQTIAADMPPLKGVFHAAAVLDDAAISVLEAEKIHAVMQPKAMGAWLLHRHTRSLSLDYFVLFSSVGSLVGNPGQAPYVSANAFLDALAHHRRALNLPVIGINWGALGEVGMAARQKGVEDYLNRMGFGSFTPAQALGVLDKILDWKPVSVGAAMMNWQMLRTSYPNWPEASRNAKVFAATSGEHDVESGQGPLQGLCKLEPEQRRQAIDDAMQELISAILRVTRSKIDSSHSLLNMGMDSLMGIELQGAIEKNIGIKVSTLELMKGNALSDLIAHLDSMVEVHAVPVIDDAAHRHPAEELLFKEVTDLDSLLHELSDSEIDLALEKLLAKELDV